MLQNDLQPHRHHAGHPVDQARADVTGHPPLEQRETIKLYLTDTKAVSALFCLKGNTFLS